MNTPSFWAETASLPSFEKLDHNLNVDLVVVGGGITGITTAYLAMKAGHSVALLERRKFGGWDTSYTTAHLTYVTDARLRTLTKVFGKERARLAWEAGLSGIAQITRNIRAEEIECDFKWVPGYLHAPLYEDATEERDSLQEDADLAAEFGFHAEFVDSVPGLKVPGVRFMHQAKFHPLKYLRGLLTALRAGDCQMFEETEVERVETEPLSVKAGDYRIRCSYVVLATHNPLMGKDSVLSAALLQSKLALYTTYAVGASVPKEVIPEACYWDTADPYRFLRVEAGPNKDFAILGGEDHKTGQIEHTDEPVVRLDQAMTRLFGKADISHRWSGQVIETADGLPYIGETSERQFAATGFGGNGITFGTLAAMMALDAFSGHLNPWSELFDVHRKKLRGGTLEYLRQNKDYPYYLVRDHLSAAEGDAVEEVQPGQGKILRLEGKRI
jgi:glycine/D-amino acid oxidase-like deaminating enzyme